MLTMLIWFVCIMYRIAEFVSEDYLSIHVNVWKKMFDKCIERIIVYCDQLLNKNEMNNGQCKYLFMVGGLSQSKYFQQKMIEWVNDYGNKMNIIIPKCSILSVVGGAARFGVISNFIQNSKRCLN